MSKPITLLFMSDSSLRRLKILRAFIAPWYERSPYHQPTALASLGHFYTSYDNISDLKLKFNDQLVKLRRKEF
jgi:hypothetical protein